MTATSVHHRRSWMPALNMLLASAAMVISVIALATGPDAATAVTPVAKTDVVVNDSPAAPNALHQRVIDGCDRIRGTHPC